MSFKHCLLVLLWLPLISLGQTLIQDPDEYIALRGMKGGEIQQWDFTVARDQYKAYQFSQGEDGDWLAVFVKSGSQWKLVQTIPLYPEMSIGSGMHAVVVDANAIGIHCEVFRENDQYLVDPDWILHVTPDTLLPEYYSDAYAKWKAGKTLTAADATILSSRLWWHFREDFLLDLLATPVTGVTITQHDDYFRLQDPLGNEVGSIDIEARLFSAANGDRYLLVSAYFESGGEWASADEYLIRFSGSSITLMPDSWMQGITFRAFLRDPKMELDQEGTEGEDLWFRLSETSETVWVGCRFDPAFSEIYSPNGLYFLEYLKYKAIEFTWDPQAARFSAGQKILR